ncbi:DUF397 domain-containing protein [Kitasatospora sp. NPDC004272]
MSKATESLTWRKSSYSGGNGACVEIALPGSASIAVRDSKDPKGPQLRFTGASWAAFATAAGAGRFGEV